MISIKSIVSAGVLATIFEFMVLVMSGCDGPASKSEIEQVTHFSKLISAVEINDIPEIHFRFFDENGKELNYDEIIGRMTNYHSDGSEILSEGTIDLDSLKVLELGPSYDDDGAWILGFSNLKDHRRQGWMVHWNTENTGYSSFVLDNEGRGFTESETLIFNEQLAKDARRHFYSAKARRPDYVFSWQFRLLGARINSCFAKLEAATKDAEKGKIGQQCVDLLAQAMTVLLREYGIQRAQAIEGSARWGVSITPHDIPKENPPIENELVKIDDLVSLFHRKHRWLRIVMGGEQFNQARIKAVVKFAAERDVKILGQLFDSDSQAKLSLELFKERVNETLNDPVFALVDAWEVGNEVNGRWLGGQIVEKIEYAAAQVKKCFPNKPVWLTLYWYGVQDEKESSLFNWIDNNITKDIGDNIDAITLSIYIDQQPLNFTWDMVMSHLAELFPGKEIMVGEMAFTDPTTDEFYIEGNEGWDNDTGVAHYIVNRYASAFATPNSVGGGFWWFYDQEMVGKTALWHTLRDLYCRVYPHLCNENR